MGFVAGGTLKKKFQKKKPFLDYQVHPLYGSISPFFFPTPCFYPLFLITLPISLLLSLFCFICLFSPSSHRATVRHSAAVTSEPPRQSTFFLPS
ncbi:hypothetical protein TRSC58_07560 [Trypanosoma rangeli SC58]|uniref:Uncharacterized protein n=1 Tax=Trypanosoma rangeli SC58 TaxID=429131 RepID=A0A061IV05_TRYRA|nr:hypothetical protein TRSC58_07560 [Trypanosoma rangeli SC58]